MWCVSNACRALSSPSCVCGRKRVWLLGHPSVWLRLAARMGHCLAKNACGLASPLGCTRIVLSRSCLLRACLVAHTCGLTRSCVLSVYLIAHECDLSRSRTLRVCLVAHECGLGMLRGLCVCSAAPMCGVVKLPMPRPTCQLDQASMPTNQASRTQPTVPA